MIGQCHESAVEGKKIGRSLTISHLVSFVVLTVLNAFVSFAYDFGRFFPALEGTVKERLVFSLAVESGPMSYLFLGTGPPDSYRCIGIACAIILLLIGCAILQKNLALKIVAHAAIAAWFVLGAAIMFGMMV